MSEHGLSKQRLPTAASMSFEADEDLAWRAIHEVEAFLELYQRYNLPIYRYFIAWTGNERDAQEMTSQTFLTAYAWLISYQLGGRFVKRLFGIANYIRRDYFSRRGEDFPQDSRLDIHENGSMTGTRATFPVKPNAIAWAIGGLPSEVAEALALRFFAGFDASVIGQIMVKSDAAVKMLVYKGLCDLNDKLSLKLEV